MKYYRRVPKICFLAQKTVYYITCKGIYCYKMVLDLRLMGGFTSKVKKMIILTCAFIHIKNRKIKNNPNKY